MPHLIYRGACDLPAVHRAFVRVQKQESGWYIKILSCYLAETGRCLLFESTAARPGFSQNFFVRAEFKQDRLTIRVDPLTNVEKNDGVKRTLLVVRDIVLAACPTLVLDRTNLPPEFLAQAATNE